MAYDRAAVERLCGSEAANYAVRKQSGGRAGQKGWRFEVVYAAYRLALEAQGALVSEAAGRDVFFQDQAGGFVDDLAVFAAGHIRLTQAKSGRVSWHDGTHELANDFRLQSRLDAGLGRSPTYELVVGSGDVRDALVRSRPADLADVEVRALHGAGPDIQAFLQGHPELVSALDIMSLRTPQAIVREQTFQAILGAWVQSTGTVCLADMLETLARRPDALVRTPGVSYKLSSEVIERLQQVQGFTWEVIGRNLRYAYAGGALSGWAAFRCGAPEFERFEAFLNEVRPTRGLDVISELRREA